MIRPRTDADLPACVAALRTVHEVAGYPSVWPADPAGWLDPDDLLAAWVDVDDGLVVGHVALRDARGEPGLAAATGAAPEQMLVLARLYVSAPGHGAGRSLVERAVTHAAAAGRVLALDVVADAPAVGLYERLGWRHVGGGTAGWIDAAGRHPTMRYYVAP